MFTDAQALYRYLTFMRFEDGVPTLDQARPHLLSLLETHPAGIDVRQRRYLWMALVP